MRKGNLFSQLLTLFLAVILSCIGISFTFSYLNQRNTLIQNRMDALKNQAQDMAYLASRLSNEVYSRAFGKASPTEQYMFWKAYQVYEDYNAYIMIVDRNGTGRTYYSESALLSESLEYFPSTEVLIGYLKDIVRGKEIVTITDSDKGPLFTVMVPWLQDNIFNDQKTFMGFVLIQTAAQTIQAMYSGLIWQIVVAGVALGLLAGLLLYIFTKRLTKPLIAISEAARHMTSGDFEPITTTKGPKEILELSNTFNRMASQLVEEDQSRRDFVANVSHELRSPITSIHGFAQGMLDGTIPAEEHDHYLGIVVNETSRLSKLIANLLNLSRLENKDIQLAFSTFDVNELTRKVLISRMNAIDEKQLEIEADFKIDPCYVKADIDQIEQVVINLVDNAIKYTPVGGSIALSNDEDKYLVYMRIKDNGIGILPEDVPHIFDRFYKADKAHTVGKGTGLGLSICQRIIERHHQQIRLVSGEGGAEFEFTLEKSQRPE